MTPRTDKAAYGSWVPTEFARELEHKLIKEAEANAVLFAENIQLKAQLITMTRLCSQFEDRLTAIAESL
jgi:hypothetical protein